MRRMLIAALLAVGCAAAVARADLVDDLIAEFKRFYKGNASPAEKIEAIHVLDKADRDKAVEALVDAFDDSDFTVRQAAVEVVGAYRAPECSKWLIDNVVAPKRGPSNAVRAMAAEALGLMGATEASEPLAALLQDADAALIASVCTALGQLKSVSAIPALTKVLKDANDATQIAVIDALGAMKVPEANAPVLALLDDPRWQVRVSVVDALGKLRQKESIQPLIDRLRKEDGRVRDDISKALLSITTFDLGVDPDKWQTQWDRVKDRFVVPTDAEVEKARAAFEAAQLRYQPRGDDFAGIPTKSTRIIYVIDISGSMEDAILNKEKFKLQGRTYSSFVKMEVVKDELIRTIQNLNDTVFFNVLGFATEVKPWNKYGLVQANILNRNKAVEWIKKLQPIGGASQNLKKKAGLSGAAGGGLGRTNTYDALMTALDAKAAQAGYDTNLGSPVDTIFLLTDGEPTAGPITEVDRILSDVRRVIQLRKVTINTVQMGRSENGRVLLQGLATQSGGTYLDLGE
jgi:HEAT repeat protein